MTVAATLANVWEEYDEQCLRRTGRDGRATRESFGALPTMEATRRMEDAVAAFAADLSITGTEARVVLVALRRSGVTRVDAITRTAEMFKAST